MSRIVAIACATILAASGAEAGFVKHPYLQSLTDSTVVIRWETSTAQPGVVEYGLTPGHLPGLAHADSVVDHELTLSGLQVDTLYYYRVISGTDTSADAVFHTNVTGSRPFRFFVFGDNRTDSASHHRVVERMQLASAPPGLALNVGDLTADGSAPAYRIFFNIERELIAHLPVYPSPGNHDRGDTANWHRFFSLPNNERWYTVRFGNSAFHCIDVYSPYAPGSAQYDWLVSELQADKADTTITHIFAWFHEPPYTTSAGHSSNLNVRQHLAPLFEQFHVAMAFQGHVHCYEHSLVNGVHYIVSGGGGAPLHREWGPPQSWTVYREATPEVLVVDVSGDTIRAAAVRPDGTEFDSLVLVQHPALAEAPPTVTPNRLQASPNPFADRVYLDVQTAAPGPVRAQVCDALGRTVGVLGDPDPVARRRVLVWDASAEPAGLYFCVARTASGTQIIRLVHTRPGH